MIKIENVEVNGMARAVYSARNAMNSWDKSDSDLSKDILGEKDLDLAKRLVIAGTDHSKFMRMITVTMDVTAPMYWWAEADTYKVGTVRNSCSKMHKLLAKPFEMSDFSFDYITKDETLTYIASQYVDCLNKLRDAYLDRKIGDQDLTDEDRRQVWYVILQLLPESYNQRSTLCMNYAVLRNMYHARKNHRLDEWHDFCHMIETLPHSELITMEAK